MVHTLYKPHVVGPEDRVTTPDIVIDRVTLKRNDGDDRPLPVHRLLAAQDVQVVDPSTALIPAYAVVAAGAGALLSPALVLCLHDHSAASDIVLGRSAWRIRDVVDHFSSLQSELRGDRELTTTTRFDGIDKPALQRGAEQTDVHVPRGVADVYPLAEPVTVEVPLSLDVCLTDPHRKRELTLGVTLVSPTASHWDERPLPRYTVGPVGEVEHYV